MSTFQLCCCASQLCCGLLEFGCSGAPSFDCALQNLSGCHPSLHWEHQKPRNFRAGPAMSWDNWWKKLQASSNLPFAAELKDCNAPTPTSLPSTCSGSHPEYLTSRAPPPALRNACNYLATCIWVNFHYFSSHKTCIGCMKWQVPSSCKYQHGPVLKISVMCQSQPRCFGFSQQWALQWRMHCLYLTGKLEN